MNNANRELSLARPSFLEEGWVSFLSSCFFFFIEHVGHRSSVLSLSVYHLNHFFCYYWWCQSSKFQFMYCVHVLCVFGLSKHHHLGRICFQSTFVCSLFLCHLSCKVCVFFCRWWSIKSTFSIIIIIIAPKLNYTLLWKLERYSTDLPKVNITHF